MLDFSLAPVRAFAFLFCAVLALSILGCAGHSTSAPPPSVSVSLDAATLSIQVSSTHQFTATVANSSNTAVTWQVNGVTGGDSTHGTISATGMYTAPASVPNPATVTITAISTADSSKSASAQVTITAPAISVSVAPPTSSVQAGIGSQNFTATLQNDTQSQGVTWALSGAGCSGNSCGTLTNATAASVTYHAPAAVPSPASVTLTAKSVADTSKTGTAAITVTAPVSVGVAPPTATVQTGKTSNFTATVNNDSLGQGVTWTLSGAGCSGAACGTLSAASSASGVAITYTAPASVPNPAAVTLSAKSVRDTTRTASAAITVVPASSGNISVSLSPRAGGITTSQSLSLAATVTNDVGSAGVTWSTTGGTLGSQSVTTASFSSSVAGSFTITATSNADNTKSASVTIGVTDLAGVFTFHNDSARDGVNSREFALTSSNVKSGSFGKLFSCSVDGELYAQPLWVPNLTIQGASHNVVFVATENDSVYAFDADANPCKQLWKTSFLSAGVTAIPHGDASPGYNDMNTMIGITGTPVIDPSTNTMYLIAKTKEGTANYHQRLHAISLIDGSEKFNGPKDLTPSITVSGSGDTGDPGTGCTASGANVPFCPLLEGQRAGLGLANGNVYVAWASHGDQQPYHGWVMSFSAANLQQAPVLFNASPNGRESGIWMSGGAPAIDSANNLYVITGNGDYDGTSDFGDSFLKLNSALVLQDWFTPNVQATLDQNDLDLGSGGAVVLVDLPSSSVPHILIGGGKGISSLGQMYVINRDTGSMGKLNMAQDQVVQSFNLNGMIYSTAAFWNNAMYIAAVGQPLSAYSLNTGTSHFTTTASSHSSHSFGFPGATPSVSVQNNSNGIVWALDTNSTTAENGSGANGPAVLYAYDAQNLATLLFKSDSTAGSANAAGNAVKFAVPVVANGKVYVGTQTELTVFGLLP